MITDYKDPIVTLNQVYKASTVGTTPVLGACVIGPNYFVRTYEDLKQVLRLDSADNYAVQDYPEGYTPENGLSMRYYPGSQSKDGQVDVKSVKVFVKDAQLQYIAPFTASDSITTDAEYGMDTISITTQDGIPFVFNGAGSDTSVPPVQAGDAVMVTVAGDVVECYVQGFIKDSGGKYTKCVLTKELPDGDITEVSFRRVTDCYVHENFVNTATVDGQQVVGIQPNAEATIDLGVKATEYPILSGAFYAEYRCSSNRYVGAYGMVSDPDDVQALLGKVCSDNPLGVAVACAATQADGAFVYFTAVSDQTEQSALIKAYSEAADLVADKDGIYGIVPCTANAATIKELFNFVQNQSSEQVPYPKYLYASCDIPKEQKLNAAALTVSAVSHADGSTTVTLKNSPLLTMDTVAKGDMLEIGDTAYAITGSNRKDKVYVAGDQTANIKVNDVADVLHKMTDNTQIVQYLVDNKPISNKRCSVVFADGPMYKGQAVPNYCVAAALAGMRSGTYPHAPLSNVPVTAVTTTQEHGFTSSQLKTLGAYGFWRVGQNEQGVVISRRQLTSAAADDVNLDEQSIICDIDSICLSLKTTGRDMVGNTNISPALLVVLKSTLLTKLQGFQRYVDDYIGPQLITASLDEIAQDEIHKDRIYATMTGEPPKPFNRFHMTFYMN